MPNGPKNYMTPNLVPMICYITVGESESFLYSLRLTTLRPNTQPVHCYTDSLCSIMQVFTYCPLFMMSNYLDFLSCSQVSDSSSSVSLGIRIKWITHNSLQLAQECLRNYTSLQKQSKIHIMIFFYTASCKLNCSVKNNDIYIYIFFKFQSSSINYCSCCHHHCIII